MIHHWKGLDLEITELIISMIRHPQVKLYHLKPQGMLYVNIIFYARWSRAPQELRRSESKKRSSKYKRSEAKGTAILSDLLVRSRRRVTGKSAK